MKILYSIKIFTLSIIDIVKSPVFIVITILGNGLISCAGLLFYHIEKNDNPNLHHFSDALWWSFSTATTTGQGHVTPHTIGGKVLGVILMLTGMAIFALYTGIFAEAILSNEKLK